MDEARKGEKALEQKDFAVAIESFNKAISQNPEAPKYYIHRSTAYSRLSPPDNAKALSDAESAVVLAKQRGKRELIAEAQLRRGIVYFALQKYGNSAKCFQWVKSLSPNEKSLGIWEARIQSKLGGAAEDSEQKTIDVDEFPGVKLEDIKQQAAFSQDTVTTKEINALPGSSSSQPATTSTALSATSTTPASKIRHDWYQSNETITLDVMAKGVPKDKAVVTIQRTSLNISFPLASGSDFDLDFDPLFEPIEPDASTFRVLSSKIQCVLKKANPGRKWHSLEGTPGAENVVLSETNKTPTQEEKESGPAYPTSSKHGPKDWDKVATDLTQNPKKDKDKDDGKDDEGDGYDSDGGDAVNGFFKKLYKNLDPDARRAMIKSYQESNGTALSTNWDEVRKGKVETTPPDGMEAHKWEY